MSTVDFSKFLTTFNGTISARDILSNVSNLHQLTTTGMGITGAYYSRHFILGDLLIQFVDTSASTYEQTSTGGSNTTFTFAIPYDSPPYFVNTFPYNSGGGGATVSVMTPSKLGFSFMIKNANCCVGFIAVGKKPSSFV